MHRFARQRAASAPSSIARHLLASTTRSGVGDGLGAGRAGKMLDDQPGIERRVVDAGVGKTVARRRAAGGPSIAGKLSAITPISASSFDWWSAISASMTSSSSPIITRSSL